MTEKVPTLIVFSLAFKPFESGAEIAVREIASRLPNFSFTVFTLKFDPAWPSEETSGNIKIIRLGRGLKETGGEGHLFKKILYSFSAVRQAHVLWKREPIALVWAIMAAYGGLTALLFKLWHPRVPFLLTLQEGDSEAHILSRVGIFYPLWRQILKKADYIQVISNYLADFARRHGARCPIEAIPNGVDISRYATQTIRTHPNDPKNAGHFTIITTSRLVYKNGIDVLIRALAVIESNPFSVIPSASEESQKDSSSPSALQNDIRLLILGDGPERRKLEQLAQDLGIEDKIEFLGQVSYQKIPEYLTQADIFVRPSRSEGLGSSFLEAMAAGLPIIGTSVGGIPDFLISYDADNADKMRMPRMADNANGFFVEVDKPRDLANKIKILLDNYKLRKCLGDNGRRLILENYDWSKIAERMKQIFNKMNKNHQQSATSASNPHIRILIATGLYPPEIGGPATYTRLLEQELPRRGFPVGVLPFSIVRVWPKVIRHFIYFLKCFWRSWRSDIIYAQDPVSVGLPSMLAAQLSRRKFIIRVAGDYAWEQSVERFGVKDGIDKFQSQRYGWRTEFLRTIQKFVVGKADLVITPSRYFQKLVAGWVKNPQKVVTIYNGVQLDEPITNNQQLTTKTIISAGRLVPWKGFDVLIELMKGLPEWQLVIVGDGPEKENLQLLITNYQLQDRVKLLGAVSRAELLDHLGRARIFVLNTSFESFSFQIVEAMNAGVPVIATKIGNLDEIVQNGQEGILVEPNNKPQFLASIKSLDEDKSFREAVIKNAYKKAQQFSIENCATKLLATINTLHY